MSVSEQCLRQNNIYMEGTGSALVKNHSLSLANSYVSDFNNRNLFLNTKFPEQGYLYFYPK